MQISHRYGGFMQKLSSSWATRDPAPPLKIHLFLPTNNCKLSNKKKLCYWQTKYRLLLKKKEEIMPNCGIQTYAHFLSPRDNGGGGGGGHLRPVARRQNMSKCFFAHTPNVRKTRNLVHSKNV